MAKKFYDVFALSQCEEKTDNELKAEFFSSTISALDEDALDAFAKTAQKSGDSLGAEIADAAGRAVLRIKALRLPLQTVSLKDALSIDQRIENVFDGMKMSECDTLGKSCRIGFQYASAKGMELHSLAWHSPEFGKQMYRKVLGDRAFSTAQMRIFGAPISRSRTAERANRAEAQSKPVKTDSNLPDGWSDKKKAVIDHTRFDGCSDDCCKMVTHNSKRWIDPCPSHGGDANNRFSQRDLAGAKNILVPLLSPSATYAK